MTSPEHPDPQQVAAHWTRVAHESIIAFTRREQARRGFTRPQSWVLRHLSPDDLSPDGEGMTVPQLRPAMAAYLRPEDDLVVAAEVLGERGWVRQDEDERLRLTDRGEAARQEMLRSAPEIRAVIHAGVDDAEYVQALRVLQELITNTTADLQGAARTVPTRTTGWSRSSSTSCSPGSTTCGSATASATS